MRGIKSKQGFVFAAGILLVAVVGLFLVSNAWAQQIAFEKTEAAETNTIIKEYNINGIVGEIENVHCKMTEKQMKDLKLSAADIKKAREFCTKPTKDKVSFLAGEFKKIKQTNGLQSKIIAYDNSYSCIYSGLNTGIPTYQDLGLSSSSCSWHDPNPSCKAQGSVACLWGCTNIDLKLGWHTKFFSSKTALENDIKLKGYYQANTAYYSGLSYTRPRPYGYRYEVQGPSSGVGSFHSEGPEPDPGFNWYAFLRGWYPAEVFVWHMTC